MAGKSVPFWLYYITGIGYIYTRKRRNRNYQMYIWRCSGKGATQLIENIYDYLVQKKPEAEIFLKFRKNVEKTKTRKIKLSKETINERFRLVNSLKEARYA
ncbi:unnamed protein product [marine sediment metagenome]|uniref:Homing endonuclease LAGLIDADG domain-containing protein n=1 Tax=marine sediment metagenome TaxID=412755 RepID=X1LL79_9ZZZZ